jgi:hypothetical protein
VRYRCLKEDDRQKKNPADRPCDCQHRQADIGLLRPGRLQPRSADSELRTVGVS